MNPLSALGAAGVVAGGSVDSTLMGRAPKEAARKVGQEEEEAPKGGPRSKMAKIAARAGSLKQIRRFEVTAGGENVMRSCELSSKSVASGIRC